MVPSIFLITCIFSLLYRMSNRYYHVQLQYGSLIVRYGLSIKDSKYTTYIPIITNNTHYNYQYPLFFYKKLRIWFLL